VRAWARYENTAAGASGVVNDFRYFGTKLTLVLN
jgi:hypothetical protein